MASIFGKGGQYQLDDGRYFVPKMNDGTQFATDMGEKWLTADTWGSPLVKMDMPQWTNNVTRNGGGLQFDIGPMSHYGGEGYVSSTPFATRLAEKDKDPGLLGSAFNSTLMKALGAAGAAFGAGSWLSGLGSAAAGAGGAMDMGVGGVAESMGLGAGYTSPAAGASGWIADWAPGGGMDWWKEFGLTPADVGMEVGQWTTNPSFADLGGLYNTAGPLMPPADLSGTNPNMVETGTQNWNPNAPSPSWYERLFGNPLGTAQAAGSILNGLNGSKLLGGALGGLAGLLNSNKPAGTITTVDDLPEWVKPYAMAGLTGMTDAYSMTPYRSPLTMAGEGYLSDVIGGDYLNSNPYLDAMYNKAAGKVGANVAGYFSGKGRYGSGAHQGVLQEGLNNLATDIYGGNYNAERARQQSAAMGSADFGTASILQPFTRGKALLSGATSVKGGTQTSPYFQNTAGNILAGALGGSRLFS